VRVHTALPLLAPELGRAVAAVQANVRFYAGSDKVRGNSAAQGGGIFVDALGGSVTLESDQVVTANTGGNCAGNPIENCVE
jgi:hypothetical protein